MYHKHASYSLKFKKVKHSRNWDKNDQNCNAIRKIKNYEKKENP